jgi:hypothetical protein
VTNPDVTQDTIDSTICVSGWTSTVRPPSSYTTALKIQQIAEYGYTNTSSLCDVAPGTNGSCGGACLCTAGTGYDVPTGTPDGIAVFTG